MSDCPITLLLIDEDPIFRLGLVTALMGISSVTVIAQAESPEAAREQLKGQLPDLILIEPMSLNNTTLGWEFCLELIRNYPIIKICLLTASLDSNRLVAAKSQGVTGYFPKGTTISDLIAGIEKIAAGEVYWSNLLPSSKQILGHKKSWLKPIFQTGLGQIEQSLEDVNIYLNQKSLSDFDQLFWQGRRRELMTARWLVKHLIADDLRTAKDLSSNLKTNLAQPVLNPISQTAITANSITLLSLQATSNKLNFPNLNLTGIPLELDILQPAKRQKLLQLVLTQLENVIQELKNLEVTPEQLPENSNLLLVEIWQSVTLSFFGKYCSPKQDYKIDTIQELLIPYRNIVQTESLNQIPFVQTIFNYLLFENPESEAVQNRENNLELYLQNLVIQIANAAMVFILNYFSDNEAIKQTLYQQQLLSSREIAKLRNNLAWYYQLNKYWLEPCNIFESQYQLFYFTPQGINLTSIYSPRQEELKQLQGIPWAVTIILELRDALSPRLRTLVKFLGNGFIFLLTQVIGRAIGLIVKGVLQGIGSSWQESRFQRHYKPNYSSDRRQENSPF